jgi:hypothetical protein
MAYYNRFSIPSGRNAGFDGRFNQSMNYFHFLIFIRLITKIMLFIFSSIQYY